MSLILFVKFSCKDYQEKTTAYFLCVCSVTGLWKSYVPCEWQGSLLLVRRGRYVLDGTGIYMALTK